MEARKALPIIILFSLAFSGLLIIMATAAITHTQPQADEIRGRRMKAAKTL